MDRIRKSQHSVEREEIPDQRTSRRGDAKESRIQLLGGFVVLVNGARIPDERWRIRQARNLVKLLALAPGHRLHRDQIIDTLWPDSDFSAAVNNFHQTLYHARKALGEDGKEWLVLKDYFIGLPEDISVDVDQFEAAAIQSESSQELAEIQAALAWYQGDLLPDDPYEEWTLRPRERLRRMYQKLLLDLARLAEDRQEYPAAIEALERLVAADPGHEDAQAGLMRLYALSGQRQLALRQYQELAEALKSDLDAAPSPATMDLFQAIQSGRFSEGARKAQASRAAAPTHNLPSHLSAFFGREQEIVDVRERVISNRLVTVTGAAGIGKTRLALHAVEGLQDTFLDGILVVRLAQISDPRLVGQTVANELGIQDTQGVSYEEILEENLRARAFLLVLDNCEHLIEACVSLTSRLLAHCPKLHILATSRERLGIEGEAIYALGSLERPNPKQLQSFQVLQSYAAVQLFINRAALVRSDIILSEQNAPAIAQICWRLDGIPLAIELAAARANILSVEQIAARLDDWFHLLAASQRKTISHHQTMLASLDWSYDLLSDREKMLLRRLTVFVGGWTLEAAEQVCSDIPQETGFGSSLSSADILDLLSQLVSRSMVEIMPVPEHSTAREPRYRLLEPIREYAQVKLDLTGEETFLRDRHLAYYLSLAERTALQPFKNQWPRQGRLLKAELENLRAALDWALDIPGSPRIEDGLRLASMLEDFWIQIGLFLEGRDWLRKAFSLNQEWGSGRIALRAEGLEAYGIMTTFQHDHETGDRLLRESTALFREAGDPWRLARALVYQARYSSSHGPSHPDEDQRQIDECVRVARQVGDPILMAIALTTRGTFEGSRGNETNASRDWHEAVELLVGLGEDAWGGACYPLLQLGIMALKREDIALALHYWDEYIRYLPDIDDAEMGLTAGYFQIMLAYNQNDFAQMAAFAQTVYRQTYGKGLWVPIWALRCLAVAQKCQGLLHQAAASYYQSMVMSQEVGDEHGLHMCIAGLAGIAAVYGQPSRAVRLLVAAEALLESIELKLDELEQNEFDRDDALIRAALTDEEYSKAWAEGRAMKLEEALREARMIADEMARQPESSLP